MRLTCLKTVQEEGVILFRESKIYDVWYEVPYVFAIDETGVETKIASYDSNKDAWFNEHFQATG